MGVIGIAKVLITFSNIILIPVLTKNLGAYGYGLWSQAMITISLASSILIIGFPTAIVRLFPGKNMLEIREDFYSILLFIIFLVGIFSLTLFTFPGPLADAIFEGEIIIVRIVAVIIFVYCLSSIFRRTFRAFREMKKLATIRVLMKYGEIGLATFLVLIGYGIITALLSVLIARGISTIIIYFVIQNKIPFRKPNFASLKEYISVGTPAMPGVISHFVVDMSDRYVIGFFLGATFVGYYTPGYAIGKMVPTFIASTLALVLLPSVSHFYEKGKVGAVKNVLKLSTKYFLLISIPSLVGIIIVGRPILSLFTTPEIAKRGYNILVLSSIVGILIGIYNIFKQVIFLKKRTKLFTLFWAIGACVNLIGNIIFVPRIGIVAAGITTIISYLIVTALVLNFSFKNLPVKLDYTSIGKIIICSILMGFILVIFRHYISSNPFLLIVIGIGIFFPLLFVLGEISPKEINFLKNLHK